MASAVGERRGVLEPTRRATLDRLADEVVPGDDDAPAPSRLGVVEFFEALFTRERADEVAALRDFLDRNESNPIDTVARDPWFTAFAETVHEHYWTSPTGLRAVGFAPSEADEIQPG